MRLIASIAALVMATSAWAIDVEGVKLDDKASVGGQELVLNGAGLRKRAIFKVYVGSLYVPAKARTAQDVLAKGRGGSSSTCCATCPPISWSRR